MFRRAGIPGSGNSIAWGSVCVSDTWLARIYRWLKWLHRVQVLEGHLGTPSSPCLPPPTEGARWWEAGTWRRWCSAPGGFHLQGSCWERHVFSNHFLGLICWQGEGGCWMMVERVPRASSTPLQQPSKVVIGAPQPQLVQGTRKLGTSPVQT